MQNIPDELEWMDGEAGFRKNSKETKFIKNYKGEGIVESHGRLRYHGVNLIEDWKMKISHIRVLSAKTTFFVCYVISLCFEHYVSLVDFYRVSRSHLGVIINLI